MSPYLEVWAPSGSRLLPLDGALTVGKSPINGLAEPSDATLSRVHAAIEAVAGCWCVRDLGSRNGTYVGGERIWAQRALHPGDEIQVGATRLVFRDDDPRKAEATATLGTGRAPELTPRERDVLVELCRPLLYPGAFREPGSIRAIARALVVSEAAVKQHLLHLYDKFELYGGDERRRVRLANEALARGAVNRADLQQPRG